MISVAFALFVLPTSAFAESEAVRVTVPENNFCRLLSAEVTAARLYLPESQM